MKQRLDQYLAQKGLVPTRSQAESYIRLKQVTVDGKIISKPGYFVNDTSEVKLNVKIQYVSRAALKLASVAETLKISFKDKVVLDVGSSTGGFTDFALKNGAKKVIAVDVGTDQLHPSLRGNERIELHEKTDVRDFETDQIVDVVLIDVSFISMTKILAHIAKLISEKSRIVAMVKPQFEAQKNQLNRGVIKNSKFRRDILNDFEGWLKAHGFVVGAKSDSQVAGEKGNVERFYLLTKSK